MSGEPHELTPVTVREAAGILGVRTDAVYKAMLAARVRGERVKERGGRYVVAPGKKIGAWAQTYYFGALRRLITGQRREVV